MKAITIYMEEEKYIKINYSFFFFFPKPNSSVLFKSINVICKKFFGSYWWLSIKLRWLSEAEAMNICWRNWGVVVVFCFGFFWFSLVWVFLSKYACLWYICLFLSVPNNSTWSLSDLKEYDLPYCEWQKHIKWDSF